MVQLYRFGTPFETEAVTEKIPAHPSAELPFFTVTEDKCALSLSLPKGAAVYGLGETVRGINKRGWQYDSYCTDDPQHTEGKRSLYAAQNFLLIAGEHPFGVFFDYPGRIRFDIGYTECDMLFVTVETPDFDVYLLEEGNAEKIVRRFRKLIGRSYIAPKWAFGYGQSRWGYRTADQIRQIVEEHRENRIPLDSVYLDIDYMDNYKDFTVNETAFPSFQNFVEEMREQKIHLVPIIDAGVKQEDGYDSYEEGKKSGYFCRKKDGSLFVGTVWPGWACFPDFLNPAARKWFGNRYSFLLQKGIDGFWNDMNEPAVFYSEDGLREALKNVQQVDTEKPDLELVERFRTQIGSLSNNQKDYQSFYHECDGRKVRHDRVHNLYGYNMTRAAGEAFERLSPGRRILMLSRSSYIGMHRYGGVWTGDNCSWWSHLLLEIQMMPSLNMCGFLYAGADIGGFGDDTTAELLLRWLEFGIFTPLMRNHSAAGTRRQEICRFPEMMSAMRNMIGIRYGLLPYLYSEYMKAALNGEMYFRPLAFEYPNDEIAVHVEDQLLLGDEIMIAPVYQPNAIGRTVYLPEPMKMVAMRSLENYTVKSLEQGWHYVPAAIDEVLFFIRPNRIVPFSAGGESVPDVDFNTLYLLGNVTDHASYRYYSDDGYETDYENPEHYATIRADCDGHLSSDGDMELKLKALF